MSIPTTVLMKMATLGLTQDQAVAVAEMLSAVETATKVESSKAIEDRRSSDRQRKARQRHGKSRDVTGQDVTDRDTPVPDKERSPTPPKEINPTHETSSLRSAVRPEPQAAPASPTVIELPATQGQSVAITEADAIEWAEAFPAVDVRQQLRAVRQWLIANPQKRKTPRGMRKFVVSWLSRDQDRGGFRPTGPPQRMRTMGDAIDDFIRNHEDELPAGKTIDHDGGDSPPNVHLLAHAQRGRH